MTAFVTAVACFLIALFVHVQWRRYDLGMRVIEDALARHSCSDVKTDADWLDFAATRLYAVSYIDRSGCATRNMCHVNVHAGASAQVFWLDHIARADQLSRRL